MINETVSGPCMDCWIQITQRIIITIKNVVNLDAASMFIETLRLCEGLSIRRLDTIR